MCDGLGLRNSLVGDVTQPLALTCTSTDTRYTGVSNSLVANNLDIVWPNVSSLQPEVQPVVGVLTTIYSST